MKTDEIKCSCQIYYISYIFNIRLTFYTLLNFVKSLGDKIKLKAEKYN